MPKPAEPLYLAIIVNLHQPGLGGDTSQFHSLRDYYGLIAQLQKNPGVKLTFSLSGALLQQLDQNNGTNGEDRFDTVSKKNAALLTNDDKLFMLNNFFEVSEAQIVRFPRYLDLRRKRGDRVDAASLNRVLPLFTEEDWRDLQVMYNLVSLPSDAQQTEPVHSIVTKVVGFSEEDKAIILGLQSKLNGNILDKYQQLQKSGQIEIITTPYAYPVVPLLVNNAAARDLPDADKISLPGQPFAFPADVSAQLKKSQDLVKAKFGSSAAGFMPPEGAISQESLPLFKQAGANWVVSDESVLARSLGLNSFSRDANQLVQQAGQLYQPYLVAPGDLTAFFRDQALSDLMASGYAGKPAKDAAQDFVNRLKTIPSELKKEGLADSDPRVVTLVLDGATAFNGYANNGNDFLSELYTALAAEKNIKPVTPGEYVKLRPATATLSKVATGSWAGASFDQWIGQPDKNKAWSYLAQARSALDPYLKGDKKVDAAKLDKASQWLYQAQAGEIFQGFGSPEIDTALSADQTFRTDLTNAFNEMGVAPPEFLKVPITPNLARTPTRPVADFISPTINGRVSDAEWEDAGLFSETGNALAATPQITPQGRFADLPDAPTVAAPTKTASGAPLYLIATYYGWDDKNVYLRVDANRNWSEIDPLATLNFYLGSSKLTDDSRLSFFSLASQGKSRTPLGFGAAYQLQIQIDSKKGVTNAYLSKSLGGDSWQAVEQIEPVFGRDQTMEIAIPWKSLSSAVEPSAKLYFTAILNKGATELQQVPSLGAGTIRVPDSLGLTPILDVKDKEGDDHGIGGYTYPIDRIYKPGAFDLTGFSIGKDEAKNLVFKLRIAGPLDNPLKAPNGFSLQTFDIYIRNPKSKDPASTVLLPGRNARVTSAEAWQYAIVAEGWEPAIYKVDKQGKPVKTDLPLNLSVDSSDRSLTIKIPLSALGDDPENWYYLPALLGQDSNPSPGVLRVKDVEVSASLDKFGGAPNDPADGNHTRIIDTFVPPGYNSQEALLDNYKSVPEIDPAKIDNSTFAVLYMLRPRR
jgi:alpha-amylase/alpha-mannosidase (GH57 family)